MYKETLEILMEGITCPIKEQILKNQLEYHFKNKTPENKNAIDNSVMITRRILENMKIFDLISVQPITNSQVDIYTIPNPYNDTVELHSFDTGVFYNEQNTNNCEAEINHAWAGEIEYIITNNIINEMLNVTAEENEITVNLSKWPKQLANDIMKIGDEYDADWAIVPIVEGTFIKSNPLFIPNTVDAFKLMAGLTHIGSLQNKLQIYTSLSDSNTILIGSDDVENPPVIYAPETMIVIGDKNHEDRFELLTSSEMFIDLDTVEERYIKISIKYEI